ERANRHWNVVSPAFRVRDMGEQEGAPLVLRHTAKKLPAHQRMQFGVFVDGTIDANEKAFCLEVREMVLKIEPRMVGQADMVRGGGLIEHVETSVDTSSRATYHGHASISYSIWPLGCITLPVSPDLSLASSRS